MYSEEVKLYLPYASLRALDTMARLEQITAVAHQQDGQSVQVVAVVLNQVP